MKKIAIILGICSVIAACTSSNKTTSTDDTTTENQSPVVKPSGIDTGTNKISVPNDTITSNTEKPAATGKPEAPKPAVKNPVAKPVAKPVPKPASTAKGEQLISKSDCLACHKLNEKLVGPAYSAVAAKYEDTEANINYLADKIIAGGAGVWGEIPMSPHPALSKDDAKEMARYILSLK